MKDNYIQGMREIKADSSLKNSIVHNTLRNRHQKRRQRSSFKIAVVLSLICVIFILMLAVPDMSVRKHGDSGVGSSFGHLSITAYASGGATITVQPNVQFPLGTYQMVMSNVPGFPIQISAQENDQISLVASDGEFILWSPEAPTVVHKGQQMEIKSGETLYWTPLKGYTDNVISDQARIEIRIDNSDPARHTDIIEIKRDDQYRYTGKWLGSSENK